MRKESSVGTWVTYACVCKQDQKAKAKMRWEFQKTFGAPQKGYLITQKVKRTSRDWHAAFRNDAILMINAYFLLLSFLSRMIFEMKKSESVQGANPR